MPDVLFHFSEDPAIARFEPHVAATAATGEPLVWTIDEAHADLYYFPRDCPRVTFHAVPETTAADRDCFVGPTTAHRVAAIEGRWLAAMRETHLYRYVLPGATFVLRDANAGYWVTTQSVEPMRVEPVGDLLEALVAAGVEVRVLPSLWPLYDAVIASTLGFSVIRWHMVSPRP